MTQTTTPARGTGGPAPDQRGRHADVPAPGTAPAGPGDGRPRGRLRGRIGSAFEGTPGRLRLAAIVGVLVCLVFAVLGGNAFRARGDALDAARNSAAQLVRVQQIATDLVRADSLVTNAFLEGGQSGSAGVPGYDAAITDASKLLAEAAQAQPGDAKALAAVNDALTQYTAAIATAQANNAQGFQVGQAYLRQASSLLRTPTSAQPAMLPTLTAVVDTDAGRVEDAFAAFNRASLVLAVSGLIVFGGLLGVQIWLARRTPRVFNLPLTFGTGFVLVALVLGGLAMIFTQSSVDTVRDTDYAATQALSHARIAAFDAKSNESLSLVDQSAAADYEKQYQAQVETARQQLAAAADAGGGDVGQEELQRWVAVHPRIQDADSKGNWSAAVDLATGASNTAFRALDEKTASALTTQANQVSDNLGSPHLILVIVGWLTLLLGLVAAISAWLGVRQRLEEYR
ncbi:MAG: hypothetical protein ACXV0U_01035 [Kineosporiaceae bacterium]